ncbi:MAG: SDR family NAD(P)-dependent oxidoreductase [Burkholderiales bacterium]|nr:MAG: SDR family NAD(P)-dependent oxidoreductase [Burkholderiales bacterium]
MNERTIVITGATDGMGKAAAIALARHRARLLLVGRDRARCEAAVADCLAHSRQQRLDYVVADLSTVDAVRSGAAEILARIPRLDALLHLAGGTFPAQRTLTGDGLELAFALQYLSRYVLTEALLDPLRASEDPRVIVVAGGGAYAKGSVPDDLQSERDYKWHRVIAKSAVLNDLLTRDQSERHPEIGFYNYGPGLVRTKTTMRSPVARIFFQTLGRLFTRSPEQAGADLARLATEPHEAGFYGPDLKRDVPDWIHGDPAAWRLLRQQTEALLARLEPGSGPQVRLAA